MNEILALYWPNILATSLMGTILPAFGSHWIARREGARAVMISQIAGFGVLLGMLLGMLLESANGIVSDINHSTFGLILPTVMGIFLAFLGGSLVNLFLKSESSKTAIFLSFFLFFWALSQALLGFYPGLENHHASIYFGDVVTLSRTDCAYFSFGSLAAMGFFLGWQNKLLARTFEISVLRFPFSIRNPLDGAFFLFAILLLVFSVQFLGVLYTLSCFLLPSTLSHLVGVTGVKKHLFYSSLSGLLASAVGFLWSLYDSRLLTTPTIVILLLIFPLVGKAVFLALFRCKRFASRV